MGSIVDSPINLKINILLRCIWLAGSSDQLLKHVSLVYWVHAYDKMRKY